MNNTGAMLEWLDRQIETAGKSDVRILREMRRLIVTEAQRREAEMREIELRGKAKAA